MLLDLLETLEESARPLEKLAQVPKAPVNLLTQSLLQPAYLSLQPAYPSQDFGFRLLNPPHKLDLDLREVTLRCRGILKPSSRHGDNGTSPEAGSATAVKAGRGGSFAGREQSRTLDTNVAGSANRLHGHADVCGTDVERAR